MKRKVGLYISLGIEVNNLVLSGLASKLQTEADVVALTNYNSLMLQTLLKPYRIKEENISFCKLKEQTRTVIEGYFLSSRRAHLGIKGIKTFALWKETRNIRLRDYVKGSRLMYSILKYLTFKENRQHYFNPVLAKFLTTNSFTDIVMQGYSAPDMMSIAITAEQMGCKTWVINWGWKDFYINELIPFQPAGFFTWNNRYRKLYLTHNSHIAPEKVFAFGNPAYDSFFNHKPANSLEYYADKYNFDITNPIILYTLINPDAYAEEESMIDQIAQILHQNGLDKVTLLLKPNPMDKTIKRFNKVINHYENVILLDNLWEYDKKNNFNLLTHDAKVEWLDLLFYCQATMNVPSTVTIESLIMKRPVINIGFGALPEDDKKIMRFAEASYYRDLFKRNDVMLAKAAKEVSNMIHQIIAGEINIHEPLETFITETDNATHNVADTILKG